MWPHTGDPTGSEERTLSRSCGQKLLREPGADMGAIGPNQIARLAPLWFFAGWGQHDFDTGCRARPLAASMTKEVPAIPFAVAKYRNPPVRLGARQPIELNAGCVQLRVRGVEIVDAKKESDAPAKLVAGMLLLARTIRAREK